jgi:hypothetical protein
VTFTSTTACACTVLKNSVTILGPGSCSIVASQTGNNVYAPAPAVTQTFNVLLPADGSAVIVPGGLVPLFGSRTKVQPLASVAPSFSLCGNGSYDILGPSGTPLGRNPHVRVGGRWEMAGREWDEHFAERGRSLL